MVLLAFVFVSSPRTTLGDDACARLGLQEEGSVDEDFGPTQSVPSSLLRCCSHGRNIIPIDIASATLSNQQLLNVCKRTSRLSIVSASTQAAWPALLFYSRFSHRPRAHWRRSKRRRRRNQETTFCQCPSASRKSARSSATASPSRRSRLILKKIRQQLAH